jgi:hypothetical protein
MWLCLGSNQACMEAECPLRVAVAVEHCTGSLVACQGADQACMRAGLDW